MNFINNNISSCTEAGFYSLSFGKQKHSLCTY